MKKNVLSPTVVPISLIVLVIPHDNYLLPIAFSPSTVTGKEQMSKSDCQINSFVIHKKQHNHGKWCCINITFNFEYSEHSSKAIKNLYKHKASGLEIMYFMPIHNFITIVPYLTISGVFPCTEPAFQISVPSKYWFIYFLKWKIKFWGSVQGSSIFNTI